MLNLYRDTKPLENRCMVQFGIDDEILMENAGAGIKRFINHLTHLGSVITIVCGSGNNGGDGYVLARHLVGDYRVRIYQAKPPKTPLCIKQYERALAVGVDFVKKLSPCDILVDCLVGSGLQTDLDFETRQLVVAMQKIARINIACDIPSGIRLKGKISEAFKADYTLAMGALQFALYRDEAKEYIGEVEVVNLGVGMQKYALDSQIKLLESKDLHLPVRLIKNAHKDIFGHLSVYAGEKSGAGNLCALAGLMVGVGSVSIFGNLHPYFAELMYEESINQKTSAFCLGMGMGKEIPQEFFDLKREIPCVLDADILRHNKISEILNEFKKVIITPHCGEFLELWRLCGLEKIQKEEFLENKLEYLTFFSKKYPQVVVVLKGANVLIAKKDQIYVNPLGNVALAKAGSGDILAGIIGGLLAQGYEQLESALQGSLIHSLCAKDFELKNYALTPLRLLEKIQDF